MEGLVVRAVCVASVVALLMWSLLHLATPSTPQAVAHQPAVAETLSQTGRAVTNAVQHAVTASISKPAREQPGDADQCRAQVRKIVTDLATDKYLPGIWEESNPKLYIANMTEQKNLQAQLDQYHKSRNKEITEGNSANWELQQQVYLAIAKLECITNICETGFNGGHSASVWLSAKPINRLFAFDLGAHNYVFTGLRFFGNTLPGRISATIGDSTISLPLVAPTMKEVCDIVVVDGGHTTEIATADINNFKSMANPRFNVFIIDDTNCKAPHCDGPNEALAIAEKAGVVETVGRFTIKQGDRGFSVGWYK